jgi:hypothetical protein
LSYQSKDKPRSQRPPTPPSQSVSSNNELINNIVMWRKELERQGASQGVMTVFDSICVYLGETHRRL